MSSANAATAQIALPEILISIYRLFPLLWRRTSTTVRSVQVKRTENLLLDRWLIVTRMALARKHSWRSLTFCPFFFLFGNPIRLTLFIIAIENYLFIAVAWTVIILGKILETFPTLIGSGNVFVKLRLIGIFDDGLSIGRSFFNTFVHLSPWRKFFFVTCEVVLQRFSSFFNH